MNGTVCPSDVQLVHTSAVWHEEGWAGARILCPTASVTLTWLSDLRYVFGPPFLYL